MPGVVCCSFGYTRSCYYLPCRIWLPAHFTTRWITVLRSRYATVCRLRCHSDALPGCRFCLQHTLLILGSVDFGSGLLPLPHAVPHLPRATPPAGLRTTPLHAHCHSPRFHHTTPPPIITVTTDCCRRVTRFAGVLLTSSLPTHTPRATFRSLIFDFMPLYIPRLLL